MANAWIEYMPSGALLPLTARDHDGYSQRGCDCGSCFGEPIYPGSDVMYDYRMDCSPHPSVE